MQTYKTFNGVDYWDTLSSFLGNLQLFSAQILSPLGLTQLLESSNLERSQVVLFNSYLVFH